ncbi:MAG: DUF2156 domain-containing protein [Pyrinomonadaceae bacterium]|nr:DUF2156 domain-containing protein [Pyrinomonadaceae bacterium]
MHRTDWENFERARELVMRYGWNTTCFQIVNPGIEYWFGDNGESVVGYVTAGSARVVAGAPVCAESELPRVAAEFEEDSKHHRLSVCYFGAEARLEGVTSDSPGHSRVLLGAQPVWHPADWPAMVAKKRDVRAQLNRARNKGVYVEEWPAERAEHDPELVECLDGWLGQKGLPPLHFVVEPETLGRLRYRRIFVARRDEKVAGFLVLSPIPTRNGWLTEQFPHTPEAPNGTVELMMDTAIRAVAAEGSEYVTLGLSPLSRRARITPFDNPAWLRVLLAWMRKHGQRFYNFDGLDYFKSKLGPDHWEPVYAISNEPVFSASTLFSIAKAFTNGHPYRVFAGGIAKAAATEFRWMKRRLCR